MSPFIKFVGEKVSPTTPDRWVYVNVAHVIQATYDKSAKTLEVIVAAPGSGIAHTRHMLQGDDAQEALKVLQNLP